MPRMSAAALTLACILASCASEATTPPIDRKQVTESLSAKGYVLHFRDSTVEPGIPISMGAVSGASYTITFVGEGDGVPFASAMAKAADGDAGNLAAFLFDFGSAIDTASRAWIEGVGKTRKFDEDFTDSIRLNGRKWTLFNSPHIDGSLSLVLTAGER